MPLCHKNVLSILEYVKIDRFSVICHFKCDDTQRYVVSKVPFEPYEGEILISWKDILFRPLASYKRYYQTPITIYAGDSHETLVLKAFEKVSSHFVWNIELQKYEYS